MGSGSRDADSPGGLDRAVARVAHKQYGLISSGQAMALGASKSSIHRRVASGRWERIARCVYRIAGAPAGWEQDLLGACLAAGNDALSSHRAAARAWSLVGFEARVVEIVVPHERRISLRGAIVRRSRDLTHKDRARVGPIALTTPTRTLIDLAAVAPIDLVEEALDDAVLRRLTSVVKLYRRLDELGGTGRTGIAAFRSLLAARNPRARGSESRFETRTLRVIRRAGLPSPAVQFEIRDHRGRLVARPDLAYPEFMLAIEADSFRHHGGRRDFERDRERLNSLAALGWQVIHVTWRQLHEEPDVVAAVIAAALRARGRLG